MQYSRAASPEKINFFGKSFNDKINGNNTLNEPYMTQRNEINPYDNNQSESLD